MLRFGDAVKLYTTHEYWLVCPTHVLFRYDHQACSAKRCLTCTTRARRPPQWWRGSGLIERSLRHVDRLLVPSRFAIERHRSDGIEAPMHLLPSFVPVPEATPEPSPGEPVFLFVGRLERLKGLQDVIPLFRDLPRVRLRIAGSGTFEPELRRCAEGLANVEFLGQVHPSQVADLYRGALAVLVPSLCYEVFPLAPVEAMAHGVLPVIAPGSARSPRSSSRAAAGCCSIRRMSVARPCSRCWTRRRRAASSPQQSQHRGTRVERGGAHGANYLELVRHLLDARIAAD